MCRMHAEPDLLLVHPLGGKGKAHGHGGKETLRHVGHDDTDHEHQVGDERRADHEPEDEEDDAEDDGDGRDDLLATTIEATKNEQQKQMFTKQQ